MTGCNMIAVSSIEVTMTQPFPNSLLDQGSEVMITCQADTANPVSTIVWTKDGTNVGENYTVATSQTSGDSNGFIQTSSLAFAVTKQHGGS